MLKFQSNAESGQIGLFGVGSIKVDKRINLLQKKKTELKQYKKGVMQKLFSQTIRFKKDDGSDFADCGEKKLGESCFAVTNNNYCFFNNDNITV